MLSSFANVTTTSSSSAYESPPAWWKFNFTTTSYAALATAFLPSSIPLTQDISSSSNVVEKRTNIIDHHCQCE